MRHRKKLALFLALCVGAGSLVITTGEEKPVRAAEAAVEEPVGGLRTWQGTQVSWSEAQKFQTNQSGLSGFFHSISESAGLCEKERQ